MVTRILAAAAVFVVGHAAGAWFVGSDPAPAQQASQATTRTAPVRLEARAPEPTADCDLDALRSEVTDLRERVAETQGQLGEQLGKNHAAGPAPTEWPAELPAGFSERETLDTIDAAIAQVPGSRAVQVDCVEYPCVATLLAKTPGDLDAITDAMMTGPRSDANSWSTVATVSLNGETHFVRSVALVPPGDSDPALAQRLQERINAGVAVPIEP